MEKEFSAADKTFYTLSVCHHCFAGVFVLVGSQEISHLRLEYTFVCQSCQKAWKFGAVVLFLGARMLGSARIQGLLCLTVLVSLGNVWRAIGIDLNL